MHMPLVDIELIEGVFNHNQKQRMIHDVTEAMVGVEGEALRGVTWVRVQEVASGAWAMGGKPMTAEAVRAAQSEPDWPNSPANAKKAARTGSLAEEFSTVTLYERLGGAAGIRRIVDGAVAAHMENPLIGHRFQPYADRPERVEEIKQHTCDFFAAGSGGPDDYRGRSMTEAHRGMEIDEAEYDAAAEDILRTMASLNYDPETRIEVGAILQSLKPEITHV
jgi:hemoglobin